MLVAAAVCPHPPLLIPAAMGAAGLTATVLAGNEHAGNRQAGSGRGCGGADAAALASDAELLEVRASCVLAVAALLAAAPDLLAVVGGAAKAATYTEPVAGSLQPFGVPTTTGAGQPVLPPLADRGRVAPGAGPAARQALGRAARQGIRDGPRAAAPPQLRAWYGHGHGGLPAAGRGTRRLARVLRCSRWAMRPPGRRSRARCGGPAAERYDAEVAAAPGAADPG